MKKESKDNVTALLQHFTRLTSYFPEFGALAALLESKQAGHCIG